MTSEYTEDSGYSADPNEEALKDDTQPELIENVNEKDASKDAAGLYFDEIRKVQLLTAEQEVELAKRIEAGQFAEQLLEAKQYFEYANEELNDPDFQQELAEIEWIAADGREAKEHMVTANLRLVASIAIRSYATRVQPSFGFMDIIQEGNDGLMYSVEKFDYTKGYKFSTYATWWIRQRISLGLRNQSRTVRLPSNVNNELSAIYKARRKLTHELSDEPTLDQIANETDLTTNRVEQLLQYDKNPRSLQEPLGDSADSGQLGDIIGGDSSDPAEYVAGSEPLDLDRLLVSLDDRDALILRLRFIEGKNLGEIGELLDITAERVRQLQVRALLKVRTHLVEQGHSIEDFI